MCIDMIVRTCRLKYWVDYLQVGWRPERCSVHSSVLTGELVTAMHLAMETVGPVDLIL